MAVAGTQLLTDRAVLLSMKQNFLKNTAGLVLAVASLAMSPLQAQNSTPSAESSEGHHAFNKILTPAERQQLETAKKAVLEANPDLKKQAEDLRAERKTLRADGNATPDQKQALMEKWMAFEESLRAPELKQDPTLQPIFDKIDAAMKAKGLGSNAAAPAHGS